MWRYCQANVRDTWQFTWDITRESFVPDTGLSWEWFWNATSQGVTAFGRVHFERRSLQKDCVAFRHHGCWACSLGPTLWNRSANFVGGKLGPRVGEGVCLPQGGKAKRLHESQANQSTMWPPGRWSMSYLSADLFKVVVWPCQESFRRKKKKKGAPKTSKLPEKKITVPTSREFLLLKNSPKVAGGDGGEPWLWVQSPTEEILKMWIFARCVFLFPVAWNHWKVFVVMLSVLKRRHQAYQDGFSAVFLGFFPTFCQSCAAGNSWNHVGKALGIRGRNTRWFEKKPLRFQFPSVKRRPKTSDNPCICPKMPEGIDIAKMESWRKGMNLWSSYIISILQNLDE